MDFLPPNASSRTCIGGIGISILSEWPLEALQPAAAKSSVSVEITRTPFLPFVPPQPLSTVCTPKVNSGNRPADFPKSDHVKELNNVRPKKPFFFLKPPSSILEPGRGPVLRPKGVTLHYEVELALIVGRTVRDLPPDDERGALDAIAGYAVSIDMTARDVQDEAKRKGIPWTAAKGFDTFLPVSRYIPKSAVPDPHDVELWLTVNGEQRQRDSTALMLFRIPRVLSEISRVMTL